MLLNKSILIECLKFDGDLKEGQFSGYASVFGNKDAHSDIIMPGAYAKALDNPERPTAMFFNHNSWDMPVGKWLSLEEDDHGLLVKGELTPGMTQSNDLLAAMRHGTVKGMSVGFSMGAGDYEKNDVGGYNIHNIPVLHEISLTPMPANTKASVNSLKSIRQIDNIRDAEKTLRDVGFSKSEAMAFISRLIALKDAGDPAVSDDDELLKHFENFSFIK